MHRSGYVELHKSNECLHPSNAVAYISLNSLSTKEARYFILVHRNWPTKNVNILNTVNIIDLTCITGDPKVEDL